MVWGDDLRRWREIAGLSRPQLARLARVSTKNIYNLETRAQRPTSGTVKALADALDVELRRSPDSWTDDQRCAFRLGPSASPPVHSPMTGAAGAAVEIAISDAATDGHHLSSTDAKTVAATRRSIDVVAPSTIF